EELATALVQRGMRLEAGPNGRVLQGELEVGRVVNWKPGELIGLQWRQADWKTEELTNVELRLEPVNGGTRVTLEHRGWGGLIGGPAELAGWFASEVAAPFLQATAPTGFGNWLTDRRARRPSGAQARAVYRDPLYHYPNFHVILAELALTPNDYLLEVGCGGGALLQEALKSGCRAAAVDHSSEMVRLAQEVNHDAVAEGRLVVQQASADHLPFSDATFTCAVMTGILGFLPDPVSALREIWRVLGEGGRLVVLGSDPAMRGTPAAPEPMASRLHFYSDDELRQLALEAGFDRANVVRRDLEPFARQAGVPEEHIALFVGAGAPFLLAHKG
ncbi:MAG TPA: methyltransferase domain-containing protein, partial [Ktedonobacteraceae bacterium]|nr:methyltransferase domain-containing protein [Ktedonobacteraceae bacterium]